MNELRITLGIFGVVILVAIYFWGTQLARRKKPPERSQKRRRPSEDEALELSSMPRESEDDKDIFKALTDLGGLLANKEGKSRSAPAKSAQTKSRNRGGGKKTSETADLFEERAEGSAAETATKAEQVVVLFLTPTPGASFSGTAIVDATRSAGMYFGEMGVFHHYGLKEAESGESLFCLANMFEPGSFDLKQMGAFQTRGLVLFMSPSTATDKSVVFELMLSTAQRLQARLNAELRDAQHNPLGAAGIERMRRETVHGHP
jgi:cell division protein ZipA